jgi:SAM-dependent methyltransferase
LDPTAYEVVHMLEECQWFFVARRRILHELLRGLLKGVDQARILDMGCGTGAEMSFLEEFGEVIGIDVSTRAIEYCRRQHGRHLCLARGESLPFAKGSFDLVTALDFLEHLPDDSKGLGEAWRVLKDGGYALLVVPAFGFLWSSFDRYSGHYRRYGKEGFRDKVEESGFQVIRISYFNTILFPFVWAIRTFKNWTGRWHTFRLDLGMPASGINNMLAGIFSLERGLIAAGDLPFGVSLVCVARKVSPRRGMDET